MKRINTGLRKLWLLALVCLASSASLMAQTVKFDISGIGNAYEGCEPYLVTFSATITGGAVDSVELWIAGVRTIRHNDWNTSGSTRSFGKYLDAGNYNPELRVKTGTTWKTYLLLEQIKVYTNPVADYKILTDTSQCFRGNEFCFQTMATAGAEGHKIVKHFYDLGDGSGSTKDRLCYSYKQAGDFDIIYTVTDEKGCTDTKVRPSHPEVYKQIGASFKVTGPVGCPVTNIKFTNKTTFDRSLIDYWVWDWGTGGRKSKETFYMDSPGDVDYQNWWTDFTKEYKKDGYSSPKLTVVAKDGCRDSFILKDAIRVIDFRFDITWIPDTPCFAGNEIRFNMPPRPNATQWLWVFGDPASMLLNTNRDSWKPSHKFVGGPGFYNITFMVLEPPCPVQDTVMCFVKLKGPAAAINLPPPPSFPLNQCVDPREIKKADFERIKYDECYRESSGITSIDFVWKNSNGKSKRDSYFVYCNALIESYTLSPGQSGGGDVSCGPTFYIAADSGWVEKEIFKKVYIDPKNPRITKEDFRTSGIIKYLRKGDTVKYNDTSFVVKKRGFMRFYCDRFYFNKGDSIPRNPVVIDSIANFEAPIDGVNGNWRYRMNGYAQSFRPTWEYKDPIPVKDSLEITDYLTPVGGGAKVLTTFWIYEPYMRAHIVNKSGVDYLYRVTKSPIKYTGGQYYPPMYPGTQPGACQDEWRTMHDSDKFKFDCKAPNLVSFRNNSQKYRIFHSKRGEMPTHGSYANDNVSMAFLGPRVVSVDSCVDNRNFPWASDSLYYLWDFGDNSDQCTTYFDMNHKIQVRGANISGNPLQCKFSEIAAPQHLYTEDGCWTAMLTVYDPETDCASQASQPIVMEEPDGGPADPLGITTVEEVNYYNQPTFQKDESGKDYRKGVQLGRGAAPCVGNAVNPYAQRIDIAATVPLCGRETFWMIFNRDDPHQGADDDISDNDCVKNTCTMDGNGKLIKKVIVNRGSLHKTGNYAVEWREVIGPGKWGKTYAKGNAFINTLGYLSKVNITDQKGGYSNKAKAQMVFSDSSKLSMDPLADSIIVYAYEEIDTFWYECNWYPEMILQLMGMKYSYSTSGCKTPGIVIKTGDCFDTFFYENYRYFLDANGNFLISPNPRTRQIEEADPKRDNEIRQAIVDDVEVIDCVIPSDPKLLPTKLPYRISLSVDDYERNDPMPSGANPVCDAADSLRTFKYFISMTAGQCGPRQKGILEDSLNLIPNGYDPITGGNVTLVNLRDTLNYTIKIPGKYVITSSSKAMHGPNYCFGGLSKEIWLGQHQCFRYTDSILCERQTVTFTDSIYYWHPGGQIYCELIPWYENTTCIDTAAYFYNPDSNATRKGWYKNPKVVGYNGPKYREMIAWDFDAPRYAADGTTRMEDWMRTMDSSNIEIWINPADSVNKGVPGYGEGDNWHTGNKRSVTWEYGAIPKFGIGIYDVTLWARDSMGCWIPYTKQNAIRVVGVEARFALCDSCQDTLICTPSTTGFKDLSVIFENKEDAPPNGESLTKGVYDQIIKWTWKFGDKRDSSLIQHPIHTYLDAEEAGYTVRLFVETKQGCKDSIRMDQLIKILGPKANFDLINDSVCVFDSIYVFDKTVSKTVVQSYWTTDPDVASEISNVKKREKVGLYIDKAGDYTVTLSVSGKVQDPITKVDKICLDRYPNPSDPKEKPVTIHARDLDIIRISASDYVICPNEEITFTINNNPDSSYTGYETLFWNTGIDSSIITKGRNEEVTQMYTDSGKYTIKLTGTGNWPICPDKHSIVIKVKQVEAIVEIDPRSNEDLGNYIFLNKSRNAVYHRWRVYLYPDTVNAIYEEVRTDTSRLVYDGFTNGEYRVELMVSDFADPAAAEACIDIDFVDIKVDPKIKVYNVFSPDGDGKNDWWEMELQAVPEYELIIYNRWGEIMMKGTQEDNIECYFKDATNSTVCKFWDGTNRFGGGKAIAGTYFYVFKYRFKGDEELTKINGTITLVR